MMLLRSEADKILDGVIDGADGVARSDLYDGRE